MANYKLTEFAKEDFRRIYRYGVISYGEKQADLYFDALFERFAEIAEIPLKYQSVDYIREGYRRSVCGVDNIFYRIFDGNVEIVSIIGGRDIDSLLLSRDL